MTFAEKAEQAGRELQRQVLAPRAPAKRKFRYKQRLAGRMPGTAAIDQAGTFAFRPLHRRKVYMLPIEALATLMVQKLAMAEAARTRAARAAKRSARRVR